MPTMYFTVMDRWTQKVFERMTESPVTNYKHVNTEQILHADKALWVKVAKTGAKKCSDHEFEKFCDHPGDLRRLMRLRRSSSSGDSSHGQTSGKGSQGGKNKGDKNKGAAKGKGPGIAVPDDCEIFVDNKQLCKKWQIGKCTAKPRQENGA